MIDWRVMPGTEPVAAARFSEMEAVFAGEGRIVASDPMSQVTRVEVAGRGYYIKCYFGLGKKPVRRWFTTPRLQLEWENLRHFTDWGIPTAQLVAYGQERQGGRFLRGALVTAEIPHATDLRSLAHAGDPRLKSRRWLDGISRQLADMTRRMHSRRFTHGDLKWRNLLVDDADRLYLIDCPSGGFWWPPFLQYRIVKDLACLDKLAKYHLSRSRRLRFYLDYVQKGSLEVEDKRRIRKIVHYFSGREDVIASAASLRAAGRTPPAPCDISLDEGPELTIERWLRILPGKRLTGLARWRGRRVLAKLFIATKRGERHWQRECQGTANLAKIGLPTPDLLASGRLADGGHFVLYEYIENARNPDGTRAEDLTATFTGIGRMHARGFLQEDAHFANFLLRESEIFFVDGDSVRPSQSARDFADNLALLLAQLPGDTDPELPPRLLAAYAAGNPAAAIDAAGLAAAAIRARSARLGDFLEKCLRDCSLFKVAKRADRYYSVLRQEADALAPLIRDPDVWLEQGSVLKQGRSATLGRVDVNGRQVVIKRYNIKGPGHALSRCWRPSRAWHAWIEGHRLTFLGIPTPRPLALIEQRFGPLRGRAWLITEYCPGEKLDRHLQGRLESAAEPEVTAVRRLLAQLKQNSISHGDLKASNLLWQDGHLCLVDLDAARQHASTASFARAFRKDRERLLKNWPGNSALHAALSAALAEI